MLVYIPLFMGSQEMLIIGLVVVVLFGSKQIPNIVKGIKEVKKAKDDITEDIVKETNVLTDIKDIKNSFK